MSMIILGWMYLHGLCLLNVHQQKGGGNDNLWISAESDMGILGESVAFCFALLCCASVLFWLPKRVVSPNGRCTAGHVVENLWAQQLAVHVSMLYETNLLTCCMRAIDSFNGAPGSSTAVRLYLGIACCLLDKVTGYFAVEDRLWTTLGRGAVQSCILSQIAIIRFKHSRAHSHSCRY
jgi:hypothetical protein